MLQGFFVRRPNRFIAEVMLNGQIVTAHVKNTGRLSELLQEGKVVYLEQSDSLSRKTKYTLLHVLHDGEIINLDSTIANKIFFDYIGTGVMGNFESVKREYKIGNHRLDLYAQGGGKEHFFEVKSVNLLIDDVAMFPDAVTSRGKEHLDLLSKLSTEGHKSYVIFMVFRDGAKHFSPNAQMDMEFADALRMARSKGVTIKAFKCLNSLHDCKIIGELPILI